MSEVKEYVTQITGTSNIHISEEVICTVVATSALEIEGVAGLAHLGSDISVIKKNLQKAIRIRNIDSDMIVDISIMVVYGYNIRTVSQNVQNAIVSNVSSVIGLDLNSVNVHVAGIAMDK